MPAEPWGGGGSLVPKKNGFLGRDVLLSGVLLSFPQLQSHICPFMTEQEDVKFSFCVCAAGVLYSHLWRGLPPPMPLPPHLFQRPHVPKKKRKCESYDRTRPLCRRQGRAVIRSRVGQAVWPVHGDNDGRVKSAFSRAASGF